MYNLYGYLVLIFFFIIMLIIAVVLRNHLIDKDYKTRYNPLLVIGFFNYCSRCLKTTQRYHGRLR